MGRIEESVEIARHADDVWMVVGEVGQVASWLPFLTASSMAGPNARHVTVNGSTELIEEITEHDDAGRRYSYRIVEGLDVAGHEASMSVEPTEHGCRFTWVTEVSPERWVRVIAPMMSAGVAALRDRMEGLSA